MVNIDQVATYFREVTASFKFQLSSAVTFGIALLLVWFKEGNELKVGLTILFVFPICMFLFSAIEKVFSFFKTKAERRRDWQNLTPEETDYIAYYIQQNTKTRYMPCFNGTYRDSGIVNPLVKKGILYIASNMSEFRGDDWMSMEQHFPINIHDEAFLHFKRVLQGRLPGAS